LGWTGRARDALTPYDSSVVKERARKMTRKPKPKPKAKAKAKALDVSDVTDSSLGAVKIVQCHIRGTQPQLQHNGAMADPLHPLSEEIRQTITQIKKTKGKDLKKFKQLIERKLQLQALGSLYLDVNNRPCWPGVNIEMMLDRAAVMKAKGLRGYIKAGVTCPGDWPIIYAGPKDPEKLVADQRFRLDVIVNGNPTQGKKGGRVLSARPIFREWELKFELRVTEDGNQISAEGVIDLVRRSGLFVGLSDWHERFGRFDVVSTKVVAV